LQSLPVKESPARVFAAACIVIVGALLVVGIFVFGLDRNAATSQDFLQYWSAEQSPTAEIPTTRRPRCNWNARWVSSSIRRSVGILCLDGAGVAGLVCVCETCVG